MDKLIKRVTITEYDDDGDVIKETIEETYANQEIIYAPQPYNWGQPMWYDDYVITT